MGQPVKLSDSLVLDARIAGEAQERSIAGQVEFWARLGRSVDLLLEGKKVLELSRASASISLSELLGVVDTPKGREMFRAYLESEPFPHYEPHPANPGLLVRIDADGTRTAGRFVDRVFTPNEAPRQGSAVRPARSRASGARSGAAGRSARRGRVA